MAEVDFGDSQLFEQLDDDPQSEPKHIRFSDDFEENEEKTNEIRCRLKECEEKIERLTEENTLLQRKLGILTRPSGITIEDVNIDGPLLQVLFINNIVSKQCRQEIEDCIYSVILKHQKQSNEKTSVFQMKPQSSAFALHEDPQKSSASSVKTTTEAFKVIGSVLYFTSFSLDKLGQPLVNENPQLTDGWDVPIYQQVFSHVIGNEGEELEIEDKRPKSMCFNCGSVSHQLRDCPEPKDTAAISERRKEFIQSSSQAVLGNRYHADEVEERFAKYKPGIISEELLKALGIGGNTLPPLIYRMRQLGYPPGWLKEAEMEDSGLSMYNESASKDGNVTDDSNPQNVSYDVSKLVDFPGFNVAVPYKMKDEFKQYGSIPIQSTHMKENYAAYLSTNFPRPGAVNNKRRQEFDSCPQQRKKNRLSPDRSSDRSSDMDVESDPGTSYGLGVGDFNFQPPRPPGSSSFSSPPPLPMGTPPSTPTPPPLPKGTPPPTPTNGSPALPGRNWTVVSESIESTEDELSLEELEEQQRLIWAALQNAETATNSDSDTPVCRSPSMSTPTHLDTDVEEADNVMNVGTPADLCQLNESQDELEMQDIATLSPGPSKVEEDSPQSPEIIGSQPKIAESPQSPEQIKPKVEISESPQSPEIIEPKVEIAQSPSSMKSEDEDSATPFSDSSLLGSGYCASEDSGKVEAIPHRSRFAAGIVPFEETPEFTEVSEATGTYLKIRDLLKSSPRSLSKNK